MDRWCGKVAIVTGASSGIGASLCTKLVTVGLKVVGLARREGRVQELSTKLTQEKGKLYAVKADLTNEEDIVAAFKWATENVGPVSILVNNAGLMTSTTLIDGDTKEWKKTFDTNVMASLIASREAIKIMETNKIDGHIVQINSVAGLSHQYYPKLNVYAATKHAMRNILGVLRGELNERQSRIKLTNIYPGRVGTEFDASIDDALKEMMLNMPSLTADEVADTVVYALSSPPNVNIYDLTVKSVGEAF